MELEQLQTFVTLVQEGSFRRVSQKLFVSTATVSQRISSLEHHLGVRLLVRDKRGIKPTAAGLEVYRLATEVTSLSQRIKEVGPQAPQILRLGAGQAYGSYILPVAIRRYKELQPQTKVEVTLSNSVATLDYVSRGLIDVGIVGLNANLRNFEIVTVCEFQPLLVVPQQHPLADAGQVSLVEAAKWPLILRESGTLCRQLVEKCAAKLRVPLSITLELNSNEAIKTAVACGIGLGILINFAVTPHDAVIALPINEISEQKYTIVAITDRQTDRTEPMVDAFVRVLSHMDPA